MSDSLIYYQCPDCSKNLQSSLETVGSPVHCPSCYHYFLVPSKVQEEQRQARGQKQSVSRSSSSGNKARFPNQRYPNLKIYLSIVSFFTYVIVSLGCIAGIIIFLGNIVTGFLIIVGCIAYFLITFASIELVKVLLDIEESVRHLRKNG
jgi:hypothetical protein